MKLAEFSVKNSLLVNLFSIFFVLAGLMAMIQLPLDMFPSVDYDIVTVSTYYPGASTEDVEKFVTIPIEKELKGISGIKDMDSTSDEGLSLIGIVIDPKVSDKDQVVEDVRDSIDRVRNLPDGVEEDPVIFELKSKEYPILEISISGPQTEDVKRQYAEALEDLLLDIDGVSSVRRIGWRDREFWVECDPDKLREYYVSLEEVIAALRERNVTLPGGQLKTDELEYSVRITGEFTTPEQVGEVVIRANDAGNWLKIKDVARIQDTFEDETNIAKTNGKRSVAIVVIKAEHGDVTKVADNVKKIINEFEEKLPEGMEVTVGNDYSYYVKRRLGVLKNNGLIGFILVILILFLFLSFVPAFVTALGVPIAIFITFILMASNGITVNLVSMLGLIIVLGMLVDDGIIVAENIYRYIEEGMPPKEAAVRGTQEVIAPVTVTVLTTCAAFAPLLFMTDIMGKFIREVPMVVIFALAASLMEAFIILPSHMADFVSWRQKNLISTGKARRHRQWFQKCVRVYTKMIKWALNYRRLLVFGILVPLFFATIALWIFKVKFVFFPTEGIEQFFVRAEAPRGISLDKMNELIEPVEEAVAQIPKEHMESYRTYLGAIEEERGFDPNAKRGTHLGQVTVFLTPFQTRDKKAKEIAETLEEKLKSIKGFEKLYVTQMHGGPPVGKPVAISVKGDDYGVLQEIAQKFAAGLKEIEGISDINTSYEFGKKQLKVVVDEEKARKYYLNISQVARSVRTAFRGSVATSVKPQKAEEEIDVVVRFEEQARNQEKAFEKILIANKFGKLIPLNAVARVVEEDGIYMINHQDGKRVIYVTAEVDEEVITSLEANKILQKKFSGISREYFGYTVKFGGEFEQQMESKQNLLTSFTIAVCIIFIILTAMFKSLIQPFIVMLAIPFGLIGVILTFFIFGKPLGFFALMGIVGLTGVVVNDSIVLVDFINRLRQQGKGRRESIIEAGQIRLRPVVMTSVTTIGGLFAVAFGIGGGDPFLKPMGLAIIGGLFFATGLTLIIIPCIYAIFDDCTEKVLHRAMVTENPEK